MALQITPPTPTVPVAATPALLTATPVQTVEVSVVSTPANIEQLLRQISINGNLVTAPDNSSVTLSTTLGNFIFSFAQLPEASKQQLIQQFTTIFQNQKPITAVLQPGAPPSNAVLLLPNTVASSTPTPQGASNPQQPVLQPVASLPLTISLGASLPAVVLPPDIALQTPAVPTTTNQSATDPQSKTSPQPQTNAPTSATKSVLPSTANTQNPATTAQPQQIIQSPTTTLAPIPLQPGKEVVLTVNAVSLPASPPPIPTAPNQVVATVVGNGTNGQLILKSADAAFYVRVNVDAPVGTNLLVTIEAPKSAAPTVLPTPQQQDFATLQQVIDALTEINPQLAQQFVDSHIPQPMTQMAAPLLFILSALKQGDIKSWLGKEPTEPLIKAGKTSLLAKLAHGMTSAIQTTQDSNVGEWRSYPIPILTQAQMQSITLHVHSDKQGQSSGEKIGNKSDQTRFLIDVRFSQFGPLQLDGLVRPKKLDMIVRSEKALPTGLPQDLRSTYINTIDAIGFTGSLSFQVGKQGWIVPRQEIPKSLVT